MCAVNSRFYPLSPKVLCRFFLSFRSSVSLHPSPFFAQLGSPWSSSLCALISLDFFLFVSRFYLRRDTIFYFLQSLFAVLLCFWLRSVRCIDFVFLAVLFQASLLRGSVHIKIFARIWVISLLRESVHVELLFSILTILI